MSQEFLLLIIAGALFVIAFVIDGFSKRGRRR